MLPLTKDEIVLGKPLPWPLYDKEKNLLLDKGSIVETQDQLDSILEKGVYRKPKWQPKSKQNATPAPPAATPVPESEFGFDDMKLQINSQLQLQITSELLQERLYVKLVGYSKGKSLMVSTPLVDGKVVFMREGQSLIVRAFSGRNAFAFNSNVLRVCNMPFPYLHLAFPVKVQGVAVRKAERVRINIIASISRIQGDKNGDAQPATIVNLSPAGAMIDARQPLGEIQDQIKIVARIKMDQIDTYLDVPGIIRSITREEDTEAADFGIVHHGIQFQNLQQNDILLLQSVVYQKMIEGIQVA